MGFSFSYMDPFVLLTFYILHIYVYWKFRQCFVEKRLPVGSFAYFAWATFISAFPLALRYDMIDSGARVSEILFALTITDFVIVGMAASSLVLTDVLKLCLMLRDRTVGNNAESFITPRRSAVFTLVVVFCVSLYGFFEASRVRRVDLVIPADKLPAGTERLRIVQISDIHIGGLYWAGHLERAMEIVRSAEPDIFVVTGDLVDGNMDHRSRESELVASHGAKYGAFAVTGNHEYARDIDQAVDYIKRSGLTLLEGQAAQAGGIAIVGLDDMAERWPLTLEVPDDLFVLLLKHRPQVPENSEGKFDLQLSGHTHGGQIWLFNASMHRHYDFTQGLSKRGESYVYVSNGTGFWGPPIRMFAPPEVTVIDLVRE
ncbi:MAG: metallophosphoesterase [Synergistaceae bacterium]|nr:metallophosphoesterase [Synergistaceae bacterium]